MERPSFKKVGEFIVRQIEVMAESQRRIFEDDEVKLNPQQEHFLEVMNGGDNGE